MLEKILTVGSSAGWLPTNEAGLRGTGGVCSVVTGVTMAHLLRA